MTGCEEASNSWINICGLCILLWPGLARYRLQLDVKRDILCCHRPDNSSGQWWRGEGRWCSPAAWLDPPLRRREIWKYRFSFSALILWIAGYLGGHYTIQSTMYAAESKCKSSKCISVCVVALESNPDCWFYTCTFFANSLCSTAGPGVHTFGLIRT